jgi:hypothetical protein
MVSPRKTIVRQHPTILTLYTSPIVLFLPDIKKKATYIRREIKSSHVLCMRNLSRGHSLGHQPLEGELLLLEVVGGALVELESSHGVADCVLDLLLLAALELQGQGRVGDDLLDAANVGLELLLGLELLAEGLVVALESLGVCEDSISECCPCG